MDCCSGRRPKVLNSAIRMAMSCRNGLGVSKIRKALDWTGGPDGMIANRSLSNSWIRRQQMMDGSQLSTPRQSWRDILKDARDELVGRYRGRSNETERVTSEVALPGRVQHLIGPRAANSEAVLRSNATCLFVFPSAPRVENLVRQSQSRSQPSKCRSCLRVPLDLA